MKLRIDCEQCGKEIKHRYSTSSEGKITCEDCHNEELADTTRDRIAELEEDNELLVMALELTVEEYLTFKQSLYEEGILEGGILTDDGFHVTKILFMNDMLTIAREHLEAKKPRQIKGS